MHTNTIHLRRGAVALLIAGSLGTVGATLAFATGDHEPKDRRLCHPVEGKGEYGQGWNVLPLTKIDKHFDSAGNPRHTTKDGRHDFIAEPGQFCHEGGTPSATTTSTSPTSTTSSTTSVSATTTPPTEVTTSQPPSTTATASSSTTSAPSTTSSTPSEEAVTPSSRASSTPSVEETTASPSAPRLDRQAPTDRGPEELAYTGVSNTGAVVIFAAAVIALGVLFYLWLGSVKRRG